MSQASSRAQIPGCLGAIHFAKRAGGLETLVPPLGWRKQMFRISLVRSPSRANRCDAQLWAIYGMLMLPKLCYILISKESHGIALFEDLLSTCSSHSSRRISRVLTRISCYDPVHHFGLDLRDLS